MNRNFITPQRNLATIASNFLFLNEARKAKFLLYVVALNCVYLAVLLFTIEYLPTELNQTIDYSVTSNVIFITVFYGFLAFILGITGEFLEFSSKNIQNTYTYIALFSFSFGTLLLAHILGNLSIITGIAISGSPIVGMVLFETKKILHVLTLATAVYILILVLTYTNIIQYAPIMQDISKYETNPLWSGLVLCMSIPNIIGIMAIAIFSILQWKKREQESIYLSQKDILTGANNRGHLMHLLIQSIQNAVLNKNSLCVLMIDIDHFKHINDTYGHITGDKAIIYISDLITETLDGASYFGRYGGEEFCVVMPYTDIEIAEEKAQQIRYEIGKKLFEIDEISDKRIALTVSIGITKINLQTNKTHAIDIADDLLFESDHAMYQVKKEGRNNVKIYTAHQ